MYNRLIDQPETERKARDPGRVLISTPSLQPLIIKILIHLAFQRFADQLKNCLKIYKNWNLIRHSVPHTFLYNYSYNAIT